MGMRSYLRPMIGGMELGPARPRPLAPSSRLLLIPRQANRLPGAGGERNRLVVGRRGAPHVFPLVFRSRKKDLFDLRIAAARCRALGPALRWSPAWALCERIARGASRRCLAVLKWPNGTYCLPGKKSRPAFSSRFRPRYRPRPRRASCWEWGSMSITRSRSPLAEIQSAGSALCDPRGPPRNSIRRLTRAL